MPRRIRGLEGRAELVRSDLLDHLRDELRSERKFGQPIIDEQHFPESNAVRVVVIWDRWDRVPDDVRYETILQAYEQVEGKEFRDRIAVADGLTIPEAAEFGLLPYRVIPLRRRDDPVTLDQCRSAMIEAGASVLLGEEKPQLRFATEEEARSCKEWLSERLPGSEQIWAIEWQETETPRRAIPDPGT